MTRLNQATERLKSALDRLDRAVEERAKARSNGEGEASDAELRLALAAARKENENLRELANGVSDRLGTTIARLKSVMEA
jgi:arginyl-tRNA synthetase